jgi:hypothetical protein
MSCHSFLLILEWAVQTCSTSYLLRSEKVDGQRIYRIAKTNQGGDVRATKLVKQISRSSC